VVHIVELCYHSVILPKAEKAITEATSEPLRVLDLALQDSERDLSV
jgi:hypothetical protein